ncbi:MAG TPA: carboxypeptidase-like regulatory domain-containing protein, partial [Chitinophaga sp.]
MNTFLRYVFFVLLLCCSNTRLQARQLEQTVQLPERTMTGKAVTALLEKRMPIQFSYGKEASDLLERKVTFAQSALSLREILETMKAATGLSYNMASNNTVILRPGAVAPRQNAHGSITGKITDADGLPLALASVHIAGTTTGTTTDEKGYFLLKMNPGNYTLEISFTGFVTAHKPIQVTANATMDLQVVKLQPSAGTLSQVNVSGVKQKSATATRTLLQIQDIPQSIVVIGQKVMKEQGAFDLTTITRNISGLNYTGNYSGAGSYEFFNARGFDLSGSQNYRWNG